MIETRTSLARKLRHQVFASLVAAAMGSIASAQAPSQQPTARGGLVPPTTAPATRPSKSQAELEADLSAMLSGATLDGSFTSLPGANGAAPRLQSDKYTLGPVRKLAGNTWLIQAKIGFGGNDVMVPLPLPIEWAGDTPVIIVDNLTIPGMGTYSARVMFFDGQYSGFWKHGDRGGNLFGVIRPSTQPAAAP
jgi:hypothetical protein